MVLPVSNYEEGGKPYLSPDQDALARRIKANYHGKVYLEDMGRKILSQLLTYPEDTDYGRVHDRRAADRPSYNVRRRNVPASTRRSLDHDAFAAKRPDLYRSAVRIAPPERKFGLFFSRGKSGLWTAVKDQAIENTRAAWAARTDNVDWNNRAAVTDVLFQVRKELRIADGRNDTMRDELSASLTAGGFGGGWIHVPGESVYIDAKPNPDKKVVDWDFVAAHAALEEFVSRSKVSGFTTISFVKIQPDPDESDQEPFEGY